jgi:hypothetical protein
MRDEDAVQVFSVHITGLMKQVIATECYMTMNTIAANSWSTITRPPVFSNIEILEFMLRLPEYGRRRRRVRGSDVEYSRGYQRMSSVSEL